ncbi:MAG TPA: GNAT family N-acetyltransferase [Candidatus Bathyarchaeia archaeon]|nr:GNAT family N-acetyltransferase [Candidatus Bathyarchaeia archaeon]
MQENNIRAATNRDLAAIEDAILEWTRERWPSWQPERAKVIRQILKDERHSILVSTVSSVITGVLHLVFYPDIVTGAFNCHLNFLLVKKEYQKKGIGRSLLDEAVRLARRRGVNEIHVDTIFEEAAEFYRKYGFKDDGVWLELSLKGQGIP